MDAVVENLAVDIQAVELIVDLLAAVRSVHFANVALHQSLMQRTENAFCFLPSR